MELWSYSQKDGELMSMNEINEKNDDILNFTGRVYKIVFPKWPEELGYGGNTYGIVLWKILNIKTLPECSAIDIEDLENSLVVDNIVTVKGEYGIPLKEGQEYNVVGLADFSEKYGEQYKLIYFEENKKLLSTSEEQKVFLQTFMTDLQIEEFFKIYPNPIDVIASHNIEAIQKVSGIGKIRAQNIIDGYEFNKDKVNLYISLAKYGLTSKMIEKLVSTYKNIELIKDILDTNPYRLIGEIEGVGFKKADEIAQKIGIDPKSSFRIAGYIKYFLEEQGEQGNSYVTAANVILNVYHNLGGKDYILNTYTDSEGNVIGSNVADAIEQLKKDGIIEIEENEKKSQRRVYLLKYYSLEGKIAYHLKRLLESENLFEYDDPDKSIKAMEKKQGFDFSQEQKDGIKLGLKSQVCFITGQAGSGKSSLVSGILNCLGNKYTFAQCALSGKAAARLQEVTGEEGSTIHRLLGFFNGGFIYNYYNKLPYDIIILDELSLVGGDIFLRLIEAIKDGGKLIMLGDMGQLEAIGALNIASDIYNGSSIPVVELKEVHRQAKKSGIITVASLIRNQQQIFDDPKTHSGKDVFGELQDMIIISHKTKDRIKKSAIEAFKEYYESDLVNKDILKIQVISPVKERGDTCVLELNKEIQEIVNPLNLYRGEQVSFFKKGKDEEYFSIRENDKVMCIKNNYQVLNEQGQTTSIFNGWIGIVEKINEKYVIVHFPLCEFNRVCLPKKDAMSYLTLGYASTVHKCQGSDFPVVIGVLDYYTPPKMLTCQLGYTLPTRAKKVCVFVVQSPAFSQAISSNYISQKHTFLQEFLQKDKKELESIGYGKGENK